jgi:5'-nucleotidase
MKRRQFIYNSLGTAGALALAGLPTELFAKQGMRKITILHTNDQHSRIEPFPMDGGKYQGLGGFARRAEVIKQIRAKEKNVLLLDSGDIWQGTPYFNMFGGELEYKLMTDMGYDASTLGNHDFDAGLQGLVKQMPKAGFPFLNANYNFDNTPLKGKIDVYKVFQFEDMKVGVFGVGIELDGLVPKDLYGDTVYSDPVSAANKTALHLKQEEKCDLVICLSHLGYKYEFEKVSDVVLAKQTENIDLILGGHTHTFFTAPEEALNAAGNKVLINQVGWAGIMLGRLDFVFETKKKGILVPGLPQKIG